MMKICHLNLLAYNLCHTKAPSLVGDETAVAQLKHSLIVPLINITIDFIHYVTYGYVVYNIYDITQLFVVCNT